MQCGRCDSYAQTAVVIRHFGREKLCLPCAVNVLADVQCDGIEQPAQPDGVLEQAEALRRKWRI
jgi:hypothetical protein